MTIEIGDQLPEVTLHRMRDGKVEKVSSRDALGSGKVLLFAVPGAFTPACSDTHLPGYLLRADELAAKGVDKIACVAVNDVFVMAAWGKASGVEGRIELFADGNGEFARALGLEFDGTAFGMGHRSRRYAALFEDGELAHLAVEPAGGVTVSGAEEVLAALGES